VGKSTFIEAFGKQLNWARKKVAVLAVDPKYDFHGSILGDKTRMEELVKDKTPIRPSASGKHWVVWLEKQRINQLCEACGFDTIIIETVGVGQTETAFSMVDFFLLLKLLEPEMNCKESNAGLWKWRMRLSSTKRMEIISEKQNWQSEFKGITSFPAKIRLDTHNRYLQRY
jgi:hypothetical protein